MKASAILVVIHLMLAGSLILVSGACDRYTQRRWGWSPSSGLPHWISDYWPWLMAFSLAWFAYALAANLRLQDWKWRHLLPISIGTLYAGFLFLLIIAVIFIAFWSGPKALS
jgi:hypothetical protein